MTEYIVINKILGRCLSKGKSKSFEYAVYKIGQLLSPAEPRNYVFEVTANVVYTNTLCKYISGHYH